MRVAYAAVLALVASAAAAVTTHALASPSCRVVTIDVTAQRVDYAAGRWVALPSGRVLGYALAEDSTVAYATPSAAARCPDRSLITDP